MANAMAKAQKMAEDAVECVDLSSDDENADTGKIFIANVFFEIWKRIFKWNKEHTKLLSCSPHVMTKNEFRLFLSKSDYFDEKK